MDSNSKKIDLAGLLENLKVAQHSGLDRIGTATCDFVGDFDLDFDTLLPNYGNKYQLEGSNPDLDGKKHSLYELLP